MYLALAVAPATWYNELKTLMKIKLHISSLRKQRDIPWVMK